MARQLDQILQELNSVYAPQKDQYAQQIAAVDPQMQAEQAGLDAAKTDAFNQITTGANRRGLLFSGIPVSEQAKYLGSTYLPSIANLKGRYAQQKFNLTDALNQIGQKQYSEATGIYQNEQALAEKQRQFDMQLAADRETAALNRATSAASNAPFQLGGGVTTSPAGRVKSAVNVNPADQQLYNQMFIKPGGGAWDNNALVSDYNATLRSAQYGNAADQRKIQFYHSVRPDLFGTSLPSFNAPQQAAITPQAIRQSIPQTYSPVVSAPKLFGN